MINKLLILTIVILVGLGLYFVKLSPLKIDTNSGKVKITTSFYPLYFFASAIGGDKVDVVNITPAGAEPHDYDPTPQDLAKIENSKLLILNGGVETWGDKIKENLNGKNTKILVAGEDLLTDDLIEEGETVKDPHIWLSPILVKKETEKIADYLIEIDPGNSETYKNNENTLNQKLDDLDKEFKNSLSSCQKKDIVTSHAAFGYLAKSYGLNQVPIAGLSPDEEPSSKQLAMVANFVRNNNIKYIFFESLISPKLSETIAAETGAKTLVLDPLEGLSDDGIKKGSDYFSVMRQNLDNLKIALECQ